jgi:hypothetical protein
MEVLSMDVAVVWILNIPPKLFKGLFPQEGTIGKGYNLLDSGYSGRSLGHWDHAPKGKMRF